MIRATLLLALAGLVLTGCPSVAKRMAIKDCQFNLREVRVDRLTPFEANLTVVLGIYNPNGLEVIVDRLDYALLINGLKAADGSSHHDVTIPTRQQRDLSLGVRINVMDAARVAMELRKAGARRATVQGTYHVAVPWGTYPFPVEVSHNF